MYCKFCGKQLPDDAKFCLMCGKPQIQSETSIGNKILVKLKFDMNQYNSNTEIRSADLDIIIKLSAVGRKATELYVPGGLKPVKKNLLGIRTGFLPEIFEEGEWKCAVLNCTNDCAKLFYKAVERELISTGWELISQNHTTKPDVYGDYFTYNYAK